MLCVLGTVIFLLDGSIKKIYSEFADSRKEKKCVQRDKDGNANNVALKQF